MRLRLTTASYDIRRRQFAAKNPFSPLPFGTLVSIRQSHSFAVLVLSAHFLLIVRKSAVSVVGQHRKP